MSNCERFERLISDRSDGPIDAEMERRLSEHTQNCIECQKFELAVSQQREMFESLGMSNINTSSAQKAKPVWRQRIQLPIPVAAVLVLLYLSTATFYLLGRNENDAINNTPVNIAIHTYQTERLDPVTAVLVVEDENSN